MIIAAQLYTLRDYLKTPEDVKTTLQKVKDLGYNAVQVSGLGPIDPQQLKDITDEIGLTICATHVSYDELTNDLDASIAKHKLWNCKYVGLGGLPNEFRSSAAGYEEFAKIASEIGQKLSAAGLKFIYHNHHFEFRKFEGRTGLDILFDSTSAEDFDFELDVYWVQAGGANPVEWIQKVENRMRVVHLKDMAINENNEQNFAEVGEGNLNFANILQACEQIGVEWAAVEQDNCYGRDPFESLAISRENLLKLGAKF